jgi:homoaconitase/3-isopropylmalate dehydratase large subunit
MTMTEKIYAAHSKENNVRSGDIAVIVPDVVLLNDTSGTITAAQLKLMGVKKIAHPDQKT